VTDLALAAAVLFFVPAFFEELVFRGLLIPRESESMPALARLAQLLLSLALFVAWHPFQAVTWSPEKAYFASGGFLGAAAILGVGASYLYTYSQSIWPGVFLHWGVVLALYAGSLEIQA